MMMESTGFASPKCESFPSGLRVLVVDDDPTWLKILEKMLKKCSYEVTTCGLAREALDLLRERKDGFDIVISDVNMPDMDGFKLLEHVGLEMDLPVIMMSVDGETSRVMKGVQHGACDYLLKPIRMKELRNIWQHVFRKRIHEVRDIEFHDGVDEIQMLRNGCEMYEDRHFPCGSDSISGRKRKDLNDERDCNDPLSVKKTRVVWTVELHQKFVNAVHHIGFEKVGPKKILDMMAVPWLTRENVASHLQKYRLYLGRLQKEKELNGGSYVVGMKHSDTATSKEPKQHNDVRNKNIRQNLDFKLHEPDMKCAAVSVPIPEPKKALTGESHMKHATAIQKEFSWEEDSSRVHISTESKPHFQPKRRFIPSSLERDIPGKSRSHGTEQISPVENNALFSAQPERKPTNGQAFKQIPSSIWSMNQHSLDQMLQEPAGRTEILGNESILGSSWDENPYYGSLQGEFQPVSLLPGSLSALNYSSPELSAEMPAFLYDSLKYEVEFPFESVIDHGLFIV